MSADNVDVSRQMEEAESRASQLTRSKTLLQSQAEELKKQLDEEVKVGVSNRKQKATRVNSLIFFFHFCVSVVLAPV